MLPVLRFVSRSAACSPHSFRFNCVELDLASDSLSAPVSRCYRLGSTRTPGLRGSWLTRRGNTKELSSPECLSPLISISIRLTRSMASCRDSVLERARLLEACRWFRGKLLLDRMGPTRHSPFALVTAPRASFVVIVSQTETHSPDRTMQDPPISAPSSRAVHSGKEESGFYAAYVDFARNLRIWFIAYGIGGPSVFLTNEAAGRILRSSIFAKQIAYLFVAGVGLQITVALLYKTAMWYLYRGEYDGTVKSTWLYKSSYWFSDLYWLELAVDLATLALFGYATLTVIKVFTSAV
jgi:hypothetical protein